MPIPAFDRILNILPPHLGNPALPGHLSPYPCTSAELCSQFAFSPARKAILDGFLRLRKELHTLGIQGFQWLDGSFLEDIEAQEHRDPMDIDVVTFVAQPGDPVSLHSLLALRPDLLDRTMAKSSYQVDHFLLPLGSKAEAVVEQTRYWYGLFSHRRDRVWKGMLRIDLKTQADDDPAWQVLGSKP
jgi:hypothetical protein